MKKLIIAGLAFAPAFALAQTNASLSGFNNLVSRIGNLVNLALPVVVGLALLAFFYGLLKFVFAAGNPEAKADGRHIMIWGIVAIFVMVSVWGLVSFLSSSFGVGGISAPDVPTVPGLNR